MMLLSGEMLNRCNALRKKRDSVSFFARLMYMLYIFNDRSEKSTSDLGMEALKRGGG